MFRYSSEEVIVSSLCSINKYLEPFHCPVLLHTQVVKKQVYIAEKLVLKIITVKTK
jgi:hypothetical protein